MTVNMVKRFYREGKQPQRAAVGTAVKRLLAHNTGPLDSLPVELKMQTSRLSRVNG